MNPSVTALAEATRRRRQNAEKVVESALREARTLRAPVTFAGIAAAAEVSTDFIYRHPELRSQVEGLRRARSGSPARDAGEQVDADAASSTLVRRLSQQLADTRRKHREAIAELRRALEAAHEELLVLRRSHTARSSD
ncbi:hypothetical protein [Amycolatopsis sp. NPDC051128]|uniref:hypothetical protein n=1 Tax=Amycolatopsis sp. NPDC051128 TaxID=3155412 RepID=UPI003426AD87